MNILTELRRGHILSVSLSLRCISCLHGWRKLEIRHLFLYETTLLASPFHSSHLFILGLVSQLLYLVLHLQYGLHHAELRTGLNLLMLHQVVLEHLDLVFQYSVLFCQLLVVTRVDGLHVGSGIAHICIVGYLLLHIEALE